MTCIVGLETKDGAIIGADAFIGGTAYADSKAGAKVFCRNGWHIGVAGSTRFANLLEHVFEWPVAPTSDDAGAVVRVAVDIAKLAAGDDLCFSTSSGQRSLESELMLVVAGRIYTSGSNLGMYRSRRGYAAIGSGDQYALGALHATKDMPPRARVLAALRAAATHTPTVAGPFRILTIK
jgi:ATP-dependent protease HslVU (ClpYQ) peptidase subunit